MTLPPSSKWMQDTLRRIVDRYILSPLPVRVSPAGLPLNFLEVLFSWLWSGAGSLCPVLFFIQDVLNEEGDTLLLCCGRLDAQGPVALGN